jgi:ferredoxin
MDCKIEFKKTGKTLVWESSFGNILDFAEAKEIRMESGCRAGICGACKVKLLSGEVAMETEDGLDEDDRSQNMILPCVAVPKTDIVVEV